MPEAIAQTLPSVVADGLDKLTSALKSSLGDSLLSAVLFGDLAKGEEFCAGHSDVKVMIVLERVTTAELDLIALPIEQGIRRYRLSPMILSLDDLRRSTDVFPVKFLDMKEHHRLLAGRDVLADLEIHDDHLRLRCEQELKNLNLRLHSFYVRSGNRRDQLRGTLERVIEPFLLNLRTLLLLKNSSAPTKQDEIVSAAGETLDVDGPRLRQILRLRHDNTRIPVDRLKELFGGLMRDVRKAALIADEL